MTESDIKLIRKYMMPLGAPREFRALEKKILKAYLRGDSVITFNGKTMRVPQKFFLQMKSGKEIMEVPLEEFVKDMEEKKDDIQQL